MDLLRRIVSAGYYFMGMLTVWGVLPFFLALLMWWLLLRLGVVRNRRKFAVVQIPLFLAAGRLLDFMHYVWQFLLYATIAARISGSLGLPARGTPERVYAERAFGLVLLVYIMVLIPWAFGMPLLRAARHVSLQNANALLAMRWYGALSIFAFTSTHPGDFGWIVALASFVYAGLLGWGTVTAVASTNASSAPVAREIEPKVGSALLFLHISDVHATHPEGTGPAGGGCAGNRDLLRIVEVFERGIVLPKYFVITGDLVDRGLPEEWELTGRMLSRVRECGVKVVLGPGNHDLVPSYVSDDVFRVTAGRYFLNPQVDGNRLLRYLLAASSLEPTLADCNGALIKQQIKSFNNRFGALVQAWERARTDAIRLMGQAPDTLSLPALKKLSFRSPAAAEKVGMAFANEAHRAFPEVTTENWRKHLFTHDPRQLDQAVVGPFWAERWYDLFPLQLLFEEDGSEFLILNTTAKEPRLASSALGRCGSQQLDRLESLLKQSSARQIFVLFHHAPFRWNTESGPLTGCGKTSID